MFKNILCPKCQTTIEPTAADTTYYTKSIQKENKSGLNGITTVEYHCPMCGTLVVIPYESVSNIGKVDGRRPITGLVKRRYNL